MKSVYHVYDPLYTMSIVRTSPQGGTLPYCAFSPPSGGLGGCTSNTGGSHFTGAGINIL
jgi:hypothetical protein